MPSSSAVLSSSLAHTIARAGAAAAERGDELIGVEHLLLALADDADAARVLEACAVDLHRLRDMVSASLPLPREGSTADGRIPEKSEGVQDVLQRAAIHAMSCGIAEVNGANVLVQMFASPAAKFLHHAGMTRFDAVAFLSHGLVKDATNVPIIEGIEPASAQSAAEAPMLAVNLINDNYTPMEFVVHALEIFFDMDREAATQVMLRVHRDGAGRCGVYPSEIAKDKAAQLMDFARAHQHPLRCSLSFQA